MKVHVGTVVSTADVAQSGYITCSYRSKENNTVDVKVAYVSPSVRGNEGIFAVPYPGNNVLFIDISKGSRSNKQQFYYLGSINSFIPPFSLEATKDNIASMSRELPKEIHGFSNYKSLLEEIYETKEVIPEIMTFLSHSGNGMVLRDRTRAPTDGKSTIQDVSTEIRSSGGKFIRLVDSPQIDAIIIGNGHEDSIIFSHDGSKSDSATYAASEIQAKTKGPVNITSIGSYIDVDVLAGGRNITVENWADGVNKETSGVLVHTNSDWGGTFEIADTGNEDYGCIRIFTANRNIILVASGVDSVIRVEAPGENTKVIVSTGGSVNVKAKKDIIVDSDVEIKLVAPTVRIESTKTYINGTEGVWIN